MWCEPFDGIQNTGNHKNVELVTLTGLLCIRRSPVFIVRRTNKIELISIVSFKATDSDQWYQITLNADRKRFEKNVWGKRITMWNIGQQKFYAWWCYGRAANLWARCWGHVIQKLEFQFSQKTWQHHKFHNSVIFAVWQMSTGPYLVF